MTSTTTAPREVIFVAGTSYSGSTLLDMVLSNDPEGFSCGEVNALFKPYRRHHLEGQCGCGDEHCQLWQSLRRRPAKELYSRIAEAVPQARYIVDSSKDPMWIHDRTRDALAAGFQVKHVLIWKTPCEFYESRKKRGREKGWRKAWVNYHRLYFALNPEWVAVPYRDFVGGTLVLQQLCHYVGMPFDPAKMSFWEKTHHTLFGNASAKVHLFERGTDAYNTHHSEVEALSRNARPVDRHRAVYADASGWGLGELPPRAMTSPMTSIVRTLRERDVRRVTANNLSWTPSTGFLEAEFYPRALYLAHRVKQPIQRLRLMADAAVHGGVGR